MNPTLDTFDAVVVGGGPAGATAADVLARAGCKVLLLDRAGRIKPCGGAIPPRLIKDFEIPDALLVAKARSARMVSPKDVRVDIPIEGGFVGMVDREFFDEWLRERAAAHGAERRNGSFERLERNADGTTVLYYRPGPGPGVAHGLGVAQGPGVAQGSGAGAAGATGLTSVAVRTRVVIGADGARSLVAQQSIPEALSRSSVFAYHEIIATPDTLPADYDASRCDVVYRGSLSPDFYGWVFPHGKTLSIGTGSADKGFSQRGAVAALRASAGLASARTVRREGAPLPMKPLPRWDNGRDVVLAGDAAGVVAPASGEGIYYAMVSGQHAAQAVQALLAGAAPGCLKQARKQFMREHGKVFLVLGVMQRFWYSSDKRRERFVAICRDKDVQQLTFDAYMNKRLVRSKPMAHVRIFLKDMAHLLGLARV